MRAPLLRPKFWPGHLAMLVCLAIAVGLGVWQLGAWRQHRADAARDLASRPPVALSRVITGDSSFPGRSVDQQVSFSGSWLATGTVYVADRVLHGRTGYWVVTPVLVAGTHSAMPVVRGWSPTPTAPAPTGDVAVTGWLEPSEDSAAPDDNPADDIIPAMRVASLVEHVPADLYSGFVLARQVAAGPAAGSSPGSGTGSGLVPVSAPATTGVSAFTGVRNLFYAIEWWVFGAFAVFIWLRWCRDSLDEARGEEAAGEPEQPKVART